MRGVMLYAAGLVMGAMLVQPGAAQEGKGSGIKLNHVGMNVKNFEETLNFYKSIGVREAFTLRDAEGKPTLSYLQISRETFIELAQANAERPAGLTHFGLEADDVHATVTRLRATGTMVVEPAKSRTGTMLGSAFDPNGVRFEMAELPPDSLPKKAINTYK